MRSREGSAYPGKSIMTIAFTGSNRVNESPSGKRSVQFIRAIYFRRQSREKTLKTFLLGKGKKKDVNPSSVCRLDKDRLCVTDAVNGAVIVMDNNGKIKKILTHVKGIKILSPVDACGDDQGNLYVSDSGRQVVLKFNSKYKFQGIFISPHPRREQDKTRAAAPQDAGIALRITGMVFCRGTLYGVDTPNHRVLGFNRQGELTVSLGKRGIAPGEFNFPTHIAGDNQYIYITDAMNFRVQVLDHSGRFIRAIGTHGRGGGNFSKPKGIAVDKERHIFVADVMFDNIQIFNFQGQFLYYFGGPGHREREFWMPNGIMVDDDSTIWVADTYNSRIQVFQLVENSP
jgi:sugar lactone lactonase YvrE